MSAGGEALAPVAKSANRRGGATGFRAEFTARLYRWPGKGGWTFVTVPEEFAPQVTHRWGRTPVLASVDGHEWKTSVWREKTGRTLLPVPARARGSKGHDDLVNVTLTFHAL